MPNPSSPASNPESTAAEAASAASDLHAASGSDKSTVKASTTINKKVIILVRGGRGMGATTLVKHFQIFATLSSSFAFAYVDDRDQVPNAVTSQATWTDTDRTFTYKGMLERARDNLLTVGMVALCTGAWGPRYCDAEIQATLQQLQDDGYVILDLLLTSSPEIQYARIIKRHKDCEHSSEGCRHPRDSDIYDPTLSIAENWAQNYPKFLMDNNTRQTSNQAATAMLADLGIKSLTISTKNEWKYDTDEGCFDLKDQNLHMILSQIKEFIVSACKDQINASLSGSESPASTGTGATRTTRPRANSYDRGLDLDTAVRFFAGSGTPVSLTDAVKVLTERHAAVQSPFHPSRTLAMPSQVDANAGAAASTEPSTQQVKRAKPTSIDSDRASRSIFFRTPPVTRSQSSDARLTLPRTGSTSPRCAEEAHGKPRNSSLKNQPKA